MKICNHCVLPETYPGISFDEKGVCNFCNTFEKKNQQKMEKDFKTENELVECLERYKNPNEKYDVLVSLSGGVDSSNALITIVENYKLRPLVFHNDHGYEDKTATENARKLCAKLEVDLVILQQDLGFMKKLWKIFNESEDQSISSCYACGNILYLYALELADRYNIKLVINGYSKGQVEQVNEKVGAEKLERIIEIVMNSGDKDFFTEFMRKYKILEQRIAYHTKEDLERPLEKDKILFIPFYIFKFNRIDKKTLRARLENFCDWKPLKNGWPNRTTNCDMIWLNTYMDRKRMGYSNYDYEYAEFVRSGEFTREQALKDLEFNPPDGLLERLADETGIDMKKFDNRESQTGNEMNDMRQKQDQEIDFDF